jgi:hypothetical protein
MYDVIGDVHGHAEELVQLLERMGYRREGGAFRHADRTAIFLGDWIDRGPNIRQALEVVREMVEGGAAKAVLGNHETNALAYATPKSATHAPLHAQDWCRSRTDRNHSIHAATLKQIPPAEWAGWLDWFRGIPWWLDLGDLRHDRADRARSARYEHGVAGARAADFEQAAVGRQSRHAHDAEKRLGRQAADVELLERPGHLRHRLAPAEHVLHEIARRERRIARCDHFADSAALQRLADLEGRDVARPVVHAPAHVGIDGHPQIAHLDLALGWRGRVFAGDREIGDFRQADGSRGEADLARGKGDHVFPPSVQVAI